VRAMGLTIPESFRVRADGGKRIGKLQRQCRQAFWAANVSELPTSALVAWCYVRSPRPLATWQREAICRAVRRWADRVRRDNREWVWRLKSAS